jgi:hypothetical protein
MAADCGLLAALLLLATNGPPPGSPWIFVCDMDGLGAGSGRQRVFRIGPALVQERAPAARDFGPNLCRSLACPAGDISLPGGPSTGGRVEIMAEGPVSAGQWRQICVSGLQAGGTSCPIPGDAVVRARPPGDGALSPGVRPPGRPRR